MSGVTKQDLMEMEAPIVANTKSEILAAVELLINEMGTRFGEVNGRLDRLDATLNMHAKQLAAGTKAIAGLIEWTSKADTDYARVLAEQSQLKVRVEGVKQFV